MNNEQQPAAELIDKPPAEVDGEKLIVPEEWAKHFETISKTLTEMDSWKTMTIEKDGITKVTAKRVIAKKLRIEIEDVRKILGRTIMARKANVDAFAESLKDAVTAVEIALEVIENAHKTKVKAEREGREAEAAKILNDRVQLLEKYGYIPPDVAAVGKMTSPDFLELLAGRRRIFERAENLRDRMRRIREVGPDDTSESIIEVMSNDSFETFLKCHRVACEVAERERAEAEQSERDRVEKLERELEESQRRIAELEESQTVKPIVNSSGDTMLPQIGEVIDAEFEVIPPGVVTAQRDPSLGPWVKPDGWNDMNKIIIIDDPENEGCKLIKIFFRLIPNPDDIVAISQRLSLTEEESNSWSEFGRQSMQAFGILRRPCMDVELLAVDDVFLKRS